MKNTISTALFVATAFASVAALPDTANAQVAGIASSSPEAVFVRSKARRAAYEQINATYAAQIQQVTGVRQEMQTLQRSLDTNSDGNLTQQEIDANPGVRQQMQQKQSQIETILRPVVMAQYFVLDELIRGYSAAQNKVIADKRIQIMLTPDAFQYRAEGVDVTTAILEQLDASVPAVASTPPADYRPSQAAGQMHQAVQQIILNLAQRQAAAQQNAAAAAAPSGR